MSKKQDSRTLLWAHMRIVVAAVVGAAGVAAASAVPTLGRHAWLLGWDLGALTYLVLVWREFLSAEERDIRTRSALHDEKSGVLMMLVLALIVASLAGITDALVAAKHFGPRDKLVSAALVAVTLALGWLVLQTVFAAHYAHRHFVETARKADNGFGFPGQAPTSYLDFFYVAFSVGATFQVSDTNVGSTRLRKLVTTHAAAAYVYNTAILAVGINLLAGFVTQ
jgi:uncharacterized membrane protein